MLKRKVTIRRVQFLARMLKHLTDLRTKLLREITIRLRIERESNRDDCLDSCDLASDESEREISTMLSEREALKIAQIDNALRRVGLLSYGICETCGLEIAKKRLSAMPFTGLCCDCQEERERGAKARYHNEEQADNSRKFVAGQGQGEYGGQPMMSPRTESILNLLET